MVFVGGGGPLHLRGTDRSRVLVDTEQVVLVTDDETTHSESKKVLESLRYEGRWKNSSRRGARRAVFSRMHSIELVTSRPLFLFPFLLREGKCLLNPRAYARDDARRNAPKVQRSERKDAPGCLARAPMDGWTRGATEPGERLRLERIGSDR